MFNTGGRVVIGDRSAIPNPTPLEDIAFLARSPHRVAILDELANDPRTRGEIRETTEISQPTLTRILGGFEERGWVEKAGQEYSLTPFGSLLAEEFGALQDTVETMQQLTTIGPHLPLEEMDFDVRLFQNTTITGSTRCSYPIGAAVFLLSTPIGGS